MSSLGIKECVSVLRAAYTYAGIRVIAVVSSCASGPAWQSAAVPLPSPHVVQPSRVPICARHLRCSPLRSSFVVCTLRSVGVTRHFHFRFCCPIPPARSFCSGIFVLHSGFSIPRSVVSFWRLGCGVLAFQFLGFKFPVASSPFGVQSLTVEVDGSLALASPSRRRHRRVPLTASSLLAYVALPTRPAAVAIAVAVCTTCMPPSYASSAHVRAFSSVDAPLYLVIPFPSFPFLFHFPSLLVPRACVRVRVSAPRAQRRLARGLFLPKLSFVV